MDGNQGPEDKLLSVLSMSGRAIEEATLPESSAGQIESWRRLEGLGAALATAAAATDTAATDTAHHRRNLRHRLKTVRRARPANSFAA